MNPFIRALVENAFREAAKKGGMTLVEDLLSLLPDKQLEAARQFIVKTQQKRTSGGATVA